MPTVHLNGIDIWYDFSLGSGPAIAMNHGWRGASDQWPTSLYELRHIGRILVYDVRGQGRTAEPEDAVDLPFVRLHRCGVGALTG